MWHLDFDLEIPGRSPGEVRELCVRRGFRLSGLRVRVSGDRLRARYVLGEAPSAPLLKARLLPTSTGRRVDGQVHLAAPIIYGAMQLGSGLLVGLGILAAGIATHGWQAFVIGTPPGAGLRLAIHRRGSQPRRPHGAPGRFEHALLEAFARK